MKCKKGKCVEIESVLDWKTFSTEIEIQTQNKPKSSKWNKRVRYCFYSFTFQVYSYLSGTIAIFGIRNNLNSGTSKDIRRRIMNDFHVLIDGIC